MRALIAHNIGALGARLSGTPTLRGCASRLILARLPC
jgi:hypothetical protein